MRRQQQVFGPAKNGAPSAGVISSAEVRVDKVGGPSNKVYIVGNHNLGKLLEQPATAARVGNSHAFDVGNSSSESVGNCVGNLDETPDARGFILTGPRTAKGLQDEWCRLMREAGLKPRKNGVQLIEVVGSFDLSYRGRLNEMVAAIREIERWATSPAGDGWPTRFGVLLSTAVHLYEGAPHAHLLLVPLINGRMLGSDAVGHKKRLAMHMRAVVEALSPLGIKAYGVGVAGRDAIKANAGRLVPRRAGMAGRPSRTDSLACVGNPEDSHQNTTSQEGSRSVPGRPAQPAPDVAALGEELAAAQQALGTARAEIRKLQAESAMLEALARLATGAPDDADLRSGQLSRPGLREVPHAHEPPAPRVPAKSHRVEVITARRRARDVQRRADILAALREHGALKASDLVRLCPAVGSHATFARVAKDLVKAREVETLPGTHAVNGTPMTLWRIRRDPAASETAATAQIRPAKAKTPARPGLGSHPTA